VDIPLKSNALKIENNKDIYITEKYLDMMIKSFISCNWIYK